MKRYLLACLALVLLGACAAAQPPLAAGPFSPVTPRMAQEQNLAGGQRVRWGGVIVATTPGRTQTCVEIQARSLDSEGRPERGGASEGRFISCTAGFRDPAVYAPNREITVIGHLGPAVIRKAAGQEYRYPTVTAELLYLWE